MNCRRALRLSLLVSCTALAALLRASEPADLGEGLTYVRVHAAPAEVAAAATALDSGRALVLDLRYTAALSDAAPLTAALARRPAKQPLFVLVSADTPATLRPDALPAQVFTLGVDGLKPAPTVAIAQTAAADRAAYDALENGAKLADLISGRLDKERFDEASLVKEFQAGNRNAEPPPEPDPAHPASGASAKLTDRVLQRAVHLHRALLALPAAPAAK